MKTNKSINVLWDDCLVGVQAGMSKDSCEEIAQNVQKCVQQMLGEYIFTR